jgi:hypothetical protein
MEFGVLSYLVSWKYLFLSITESPLKIVFSSITSQFIIFDLGCDIVVKNAIFFLSTSSSYVDTG